MKSKFIYLFLFLLFRVYVVQSASASVIFDGLTWYMSQEPARLFLNDNYQLTWKNPRGPDMITVKLPVMDLSDVNDAAVVAYMYKADGEKTGIPSTDPTLISGTGDIRIGLFDSCRNGYIEKDGTGYTSEKFCGYLGYHARICPHLPVGIKRKHSDAIPGKFMKRTRPYGDDGPALVSSAGSYGKSRDMSGFGLPLGVYSPFILRIERTDESTIVFSITINGVTYSYVDDEPEFQPGKIDVMAMYFPNPKTYSSITFAGCHFACMPRK
jgi:hypothetical protein